uniref:Kinesin-like protein n=1 Tax=Strongyloides papillosus TaxID=174720 RepID=A0A0N5B4F1_STREA
MENIAVGLRVAILRSDGSLQDAMITDVDHETQMVKAVFDGENNMKRSKKVSFRDLLRLNEHLSEKVDKPEPLPAPPQQQQAPPRPRNTRRSVQQHQNKPSRPSSTTNNAPRMSLVNPTNLTTIDEAETTTLLRKTFTPGFGTRETTNVRKTSAHPVDDKETTSMGHVLHHKLPKSHLHYQYNTLILEEEKKLTFRNLEYNEVGQCTKKMTSYIRVRPLNATEIRGQEISSVTVPTTNSIVLFSPQAKVTTDKFITPHSFTYDGVFNENASTECIYKVACKQLIPTFLSGECATCFAYGQTGSGKTFTMHGGAGKNKSSGLYDMVSLDVFEGFKGGHLGKRGYAIKCAFFEIYMNKAYDLLDGRKELRVQADSDNRVQIPNLTNHYCRTPMEVSQVLRQGSLLRSTGKTKSNKGSSRSHAVFQFILVHNEKVVSRLSMVDLAGNERGIDAGNVDRQTRNEGNAINGSLLALKECIRHMSTGVVDRIPFRNSALTQFLKDSFIGEHSKLCMITTISPAITSFEATLNSLRYAYQVVQINSRDSLLPGQLLTEIAGVRINQPLNVINEDQEECISSPTSNDENCEGQSPTEVIEASEIETLKSMFQNAIEELDEIDSLIQVPNQKIIAVRKLKVLKDRFNLV